MFWENYVLDYQRFDGSASSADTFIIAMEVVGLETPKSHTLDGVNLLPFIA